MTHAPANYFASPADERADLDIVGTHLRTRHRDRRLMLAVAGILSILVAALALQSLLAVTLVPDATFTFRV